MFCELVTALATCGEQNPSTSALQHRHMLYPAPQQSALDMSSWHCADICVPAPQSTRSWLDQPSLALTLDDNVHDEMRQRWEADRRNAAAFGDVVDYYALLGEPASGAQHGHWLLL